MQCRCNQCMEEFPEEAIVLKTASPVYGPAEACPYCGERGCIMDLGEYAFEMFNGNVGRVEWFMTLKEAIDVAEDGWHHLTPRERVAYTDRSRGGIFEVYDSDGHVYRDWKDEADADDLVYIYRWKARKARR